MWLSKSDSLRRLRSVALVLAAALLGSGPVFLARADEPAAAVQGQTGLSIESAAQPVRMDLAALRKLPALEQRVTFMTEHGERSATFQGASLWAVLVDAHAVDPAKGREQVDKIVAITGQDGYTAVLALGEISPNFEGKPVLIAYAADGKLFSTPRVVVPGDKPGGRSVRDVVRIVVR